MVEYDPSNGATYCYVPCIHFYDPKADVDKWIEVWHTAYANLGAAQSFFIHHITGPWRTEDNCWVGDLKTDFPGGGYQVSIKQCLIASIP